MVGAVMTQQTPTKTPRNTEGLRDMLFEELDNFRAGKSSTKRAQIVVNFAKEILNTSRLELINAAVLLDKNKNGTPRLALK